jgi:hypothetical protein
MRVHELLFRLYAARHYIWLVVWNIFFFHIYIYIINVYLVGGLEHFLFFHILGIIIPIDFHISRFVSGGVPARR